MSCHEDLTDGCVSILSYHLTRLEFCALHLNRGICLSKSRATNKYSCAKFKESFKCNSAAISLKYDTSRVDRACSCRSIVGDCSLEGRLISLSQTETPSNKDLVIASNRR